MGVDAKSKVLEAETKIMAEKNRVMLTDLATISDPVQTVWIEKKQKKNDPSSRCLMGNGIDECHLDENSHFWVKLVTFWTNCNILCHFAYFRVAC
jgi:hypothetical protein